MTPEQLADMTDEQVDRTVAEMMGWTGLHEMSPHTWRGRPPGRPPDVLRLIPTPTDYADGPCDDYAVLCWVRGDSGWPEEKQWVFSYHLSQLLEGQRTATTIPVMREALYVVGFYAKAALLAEDSE